MTGSLKNEIASSPAPQVPRKDNWHLRGKDLASPENRGNDRIVTSTTHVVEAADARWALARLEIASLPPTGAFGTLRGAVRSSPAPQVPRNDSSRIRSEERRGTNNVQQFMIFTPI